MLQLHTPGHSITRTKDGVTEYMANPIYVGDGGWFQEFCYKTHVLPNIVAATEWAAKLASRDPESVFEVVPAIKIQGVALP